MTIREAETRQTNIFSDNLLHVSENSFLRKEFLTGFNKVILIKDKTTLPN